MEPTPKPSFIDRMVENPPWKSRAFWVLGGMFALVILLRVSFIPNTGSGNERVRQFGQIVGVSLVDLVAWFVLPYLFFLLAEKLIKRSTLTQAQSRISKLLALGVAVALAAICIWLFSPV